MEGVINAINIVLCIFMVIGTGMYLTFKNKLNDQNSSLISHLVVKVALPGTIISKLFDSFTSESMRECLRGLIVPVLSILIILGIGAVLAKALKLKTNRQGVFNCMFAFSNTVFIGVPVSTALFGDAVLPYTLMYYFANTAIFWTLGVMLLRRDGGVKSEGDFKALPGYLVKKVSALVSRQPAPQNKGAEAAWGMVKKAVPLPLVVFFVSMILVLMGVKLPKSVMSAAKYIGNMVTPLSLFFIGIVITRMIRKKSFRWEKGYLMLLVGRFILSPIAVFLLAKLFGLPDLMTKVLIVQSGMPVMSQTPIVAGSMGSDEEYGAGGVALSTLISLIAIPVYMTIL